jgi:NAD(P)-dependent dehydrogenase (short-subunit alcohol dehydrogenase family)
MGRLEGKVAVVTGASQGIGWAIARLMAQEGASVVMSARRADKIAEVAEAITAEGNGPAIGVQADVARREDAQRTIDTARERFGRLDILVNNAQSIAWGLIEDITDADFALTFGSGFMASIYHMQAALPLLKERGGSIINLGSRQGIYGQPGEAIYGGNKEAIRALSRTAAREWGQHQIRVNVINPAGLSPLCEEYLSSDPVRAQTYIDEMPLGRFGRLMEDIAPVALYLASDDARYVTGQTINCDGGQVML